MPLCVEKVKVSFTNIDKQVDYCWSAFLEVLIINTGNNIRLVSVPVIKVREVSHPKPLVPPKPLKQKITNPAINTNEV